MKQVVDIQEFRHQRHGDNFESFCRLRLFTDGTENFVVVMEETGEGRSVTNGAEEIATSTVKMFELIPEKTRFIEHYPEGQSGDENFSEVTFKEEPEYSKIYGTMAYYDGWRLISPSWSPLTREQAEEICGEPL